MIEGDPKDLFSIATTPKCSAIPFSKLLHFTLDSYLIMLSIKQDGNKYHFLNLWYDSTGDWALVSRAIRKHSTH